MKGQSEQRVFVFLMVLGLIGLCIFTTLEAAPVKTTGEIEMVQPAGWAWNMEYDAHYAQEVNEPNSRANLNNAEAEKAMADAARIKAEADEKYMIVKAAGAFASVIGFMAMMALLLGGLVWMTIRRG